MNYSVIYSFDLPNDMSVTECNPPRTLTRRKMVLSEGDDAREYDYLGGVWERCKHRKWVGVLSQKDFDVLVAQTNLRFEDVETMGSIGAPGFGFQHVPAFSFKVDDEYYGACIGGAYVTPIPESDEEMAKMEQLGWDGVKANLKEKYS